MENSYASIEKISGVNILYPMEMFSFFINLINLG